MSTPADDHVYWLRDAERPDVDRYLREVAALGVQRVFIGGHAIRDIRPEAQVAAEVLAQALRDTNTRVHTIHALFGGEMDLGIADEDQRTRGLATHTRTLQIAADLGAPNVVFHIGGRRSHVAMDRVLHSVEQLLPTAAHTGVDIAIENLPPGLLGSDPADLVEIMAAFESPRVGVCLDTGHANLTGGCDRWLDAVGPRINMVHLHDNQGDSDSHLPPGMGTIAWDRVQRRLREHGYQGPWVSETRMQPDWTPKRLFAHFRDLFG
jgi:sugar phosphate isomerase/epimerase